MIIIVIIIVIIVIIYIMFSIISTDIIILRNIILLNLACSRRRLYMIIIINFICVDIIPIILIRILIRILQRPDGFCSGASSSVFCCYRRWRRTLDHLILSLFFQ